MTVSSSTVVASDAITFNAEDWDASLQVSADNAGTPASGESFSAAASEGAALSIGTLAAGERYPVLEKRIVGAGETAGSQTRTLRVKYEA